MPVTKEDHLASLLGGGVEEEELEPSAEVEGEPSGEASVETEEEVAQQQPSVEDLQERLAEALRRAEAAENAHRGVVRDLTQRRKKYGELEKELKEIREAIRSQRKGDDAPDPQGDPVGYITGQIREELSPIREELETVKKRFEGMTEQEKVREFDIAVNTRISSELGNDQGKISTISRKMQSLATQAYESLLNQGMDPAEAAMEVQVGARRYLAQAASSGQSLSKFVDDFYERSGLPPIDSQVSGNATADVVKNVQKKASSLSQVGTGGGGGGKKLTLEQYVGLSAAERSKVSREQFKQLTEKGWTYV